MLFKLFRLIAVLLFASGLLCLVGVTVYFIFDTSFIGGLGVIFIISSVPFASISFFYKKKGNNFEAVGKKNKKSMEEELAHINKKSMK